MLYLGGCSCCRWCIFEFSRWCCSSIGAYAGLFLYISLRCHFSRPVAAFSSSSSLASSFFSSFSYFSSSHQSALQAAVATSTAAQCIIAIQIHICCLMPRTQQVVVQYYTSQLRNDLSYRYRTMYT